MQETVLKNVAGLVTILSLFFSAYIIKAGALDLIHASSYTRYIDSANYLIALGYIALSILALVRVRARSAEDHTYITVTLIGCVLIIYMSFNIILNSVFDLPQSTNLWSADHRHQVARLCCFSGLALLLLIWRVGDVFAKPKQR